MRQTGRGKRQTGKWLLTILTISWMAVIFSFSAQPADKSSQTSLGVGGALVRIFVPDYEEWSEQEQTAYVETINHPIRKMGHATEYAILGGCLLLTVYAWGIMGKKAVGAAFAFGVLYACTDEFHQLFVPGRSAQVTDVLIDGAGVLAGVTVTFLFVLAVGHRRQAQGTGKKIEGKAAEETGEHEKQAKEEAYGEETSTNFDQNTAADTGTAGANGI